MRVPVAIAPQLAALFLVASLQCFADQPPGSSTLENLLQEGETKSEARPVAVDASDDGVRPVALKGALTRPKNGVQHPDLDKAWSDYDAVVAKAAEGVRASIAKQFDAAIKKGDLDLADKWQAALDKFQKGGEIPTATETKSAVTATTAAIKKGNDELSKVYDGLVKALTIEKKIAEAKAAREEARLLKAASVQAAATSPAGRPATTQGARQKAPETYIGMWRHPIGTLEEIREGGIFIVRGDPRDEYSGTWVLDMNDPRGPCVVRTANNRKIHRFYFNPAMPDVLMQDNVPFQRVR